MSAPEKSSALTKGPRAVALGRAYVDRLGLTELYAACGSAFELSLDVKDAAAGPVAPLRPQASKPIPK